METMLGSEEEIKGEATEELKFVEVAVEVESSDALVLVLSDGSAWSIFENIACEMIARPANGLNCANFMDGQLLQLSENMFLNLKGDKPSELYSYVDKKLKL